MIPSSSGKTTLPVNYLFWGLAQQVFMLWCYVLQLFKVLLVTGVVSHSWSKAKQENFIAHVQGALGD